MGCDYCYARKLYTRFKWDKSIRFDPDELASWSKAKAGEKIFVGSTIELFGPWVTDQWMQLILFHVKLYPNVIFQFLTKQPQNLVKFSPFPDNCYVGVTATRQKYYLDALAGLAKIEANKRFISFEPLLGHIEVGDGIKYIDQVILGGQTQPTVLPKEIWVREITDAAVKAGVAVFHKNNLGDIFDAEFPKRQEMPKV